LGALTVHFLGSGTPLGEGGRLQACILVSNGDRRVLLDCGSTSMVALACAGVEPESIDAILISHLHADHFGGVPLLLLDAAVRPARVRRPVIVAGPGETAIRVRAALEVSGWSAAWTNAMANSRVEFVTLHDRQAKVIAGLSVTCFAVPHNPVTAPTALRLVWDGTTIGYSGDAGWTPALRDVAADADLFICGVWSFATADPTFLDYRTLVAQRGGLSCKRLILTHLGPDMLAHLDDLAADAVELAEDGLTLTLAPEPAG
jgi:ribonuclease BN (tRNA processing enzyme)